MESTLRNKSRITTQIELSALGRHAFCKAKSRAGSLRVSTYSRNPEPVLAAHWRVSQTKKRKIIFWENK